MNPYEDLQILVDQVPAFLQPFIVALAGMIPYIEGEGSAALGVLAGVNPFAAAVAGAAGNILAVTVVVVFGDRIRSAIVRRRALRTEVAAPAGSRVDVGADSRVAVLAGAPAGADAPVGPDGHVDVGTEGSEDPAPVAAARTAKKPSKGRERLMRWVVRFGVPGASLIGPLALPTHLTAATLVATGVRRNWVLLWQVIAILLWTTGVTLAATGLLAVLFG